MIIKCLPGKTMYGIFGWRLPGPRRHRGTPGKAWPATSARCAPIAFVARSDDVIPPCVQDHSRSHAFACAQY